MVGAGGPGPCSPGQRGDGIRAFVALDLDATSLRRLTHWVEHARVSQGAPRASWTQPSAMHVTLKFLGDDFPLEGVVPLGRALAALVDGHAAPRPAGMCLDAFPSTGHARALVAELQDASGEVTEMAREVDVLAFQHGAPASESRPYRPHVTLARLKRPCDIGPWLRMQHARDPGTCAMASLSLYRSDRRREGPIYVPLARHVYASRCA